MHELMKKVQETSVREGQAVLWWLGQMGLLVKIGRTVVCIDCFAEPSGDRRVPPLVPAEEMQGIDAFLGTHNHRDHMDHESWKIWARTCPEAKFVFPAPHEAEVLADGVRAENCLGMHEGMTVSIGDVTIRCIAAAHEFLDRDAETGFYPCLQYILEGGGVRIYHAGDTLRYEGMLGKLKAMGRLDAALLPINGRDGERYRRNCIGNMTFQESADLAGELDVKMVIPGHWDMFAGNTADPGLFEDYLDAKYPGKMICRIPEYAEPILAGKEQ